MYMMNDKWSHLKEKIENILHVGQKIKLYWRGDRRTFEGWVIKKLIKCQDMRKIE